MCGIAGFSHTTPLTRAMTPYLLWDIESRGKDSWGATDGTNVIKVLGLVTDTYIDFGEEIAGWDRSIFHTRAASMGGVTVANQHPFRFDEGEGPDWKRTIVGIHNGIVTNHSSLSAKYSRNFDVDSMHIFANFAERKPASEIHGWGNLAWYEYSPAVPDGVLRLLRFNNDALHIARLESGEIVFCSNEGAIRRAARMAGGKVKHFLKTSEEYIYSVEFDADANRWEVYQSKNKLPFGTRVYSEYHGNNVWPGHVNGGTGSRNHGSHNSFRAQNHRADVAAGTCAVVGCHEKVTSGSRKTALLCTRHWIDAVRSAEASIPPPAPAPVVEVVG